jgi:hypothetical protein
MVNLNCRLLLSIRTFGSCQNASIIYPYVLFVGRPPRFRSTSVFPTPAGVKFPRLSRPERRRDLSVNALEDRFVTLGQSRPCPAPGPRCPSCSNRSPQSPPTDAADSHIDFRPRRGNVGEMGLLPPWSNMVATEIFFIFHPRVKQQAPPFMGPMARNFRLKTWPVASDANPPLVIY